ncbi:MAG TPA: hypothetical protein VNX69_17230 [Steroidobacteraceae bacterium]|nr:hypothetical protein [Steroidobacteraceae bacterium]
MTSRILIKEDGFSKPAAQCLALAFLLLSTAAWPREAPSPFTDKAAAAKLKRDSARCREHADLDACYDAIRWSPGDPALLVGLGDALERAQRPADAIRNYRRAVALAPDTLGLATKISAAEAKLAKRGPAANGASAKRYSNAAPETQSH